LPVVAALGSCLEEAGGEACLYVDPDDVEGMKNAILYCIEHREALNRASREYVRRFENSDVATQISNVYISL
jgi:glycosyltransferase involved in cell wall biosynthesis